MKTYFKYEGIIKSKEAAEAIAAPSGLGPFCGFGSASINGNKLVVSPQGVSGSKYANIIKDRIMARYMAKASEDGELPDINFGCISRDGYIFISDEQTLTIENIQGTQGSTEEVLLFAVHTTISEPVDNPVDFVAYWNESSESFYDLFKKSTDIYYPILEENRNPNVLTNDSYSDYNMTFSNLLEMVETACPYYSNNKNSVVLIGIYGKGTDAMTKRNENFSIVPYQGKFQEIPYTTATHSMMKESIKRTEQNNNGFPVVDESGNKLNIKQYIDAQLEALRKEFADSLSTANLPIGSIILWESDVIPEGWAEYTKASGRIVIGYQAGGIQIGNEVMLQNVGDYYTPSNGNFVINIKGDDLPKHRHALGVSNGTQDDANKWQNVRPQSFQNRETGLNGDHGRGTPTKGIQNGAIVVSWNLLGESFINETSVETLTIEKLPPTITLRYIQKISS